MDPSSAPGHAEKQLDEGVTMAVSRALELLEAIAGHLEALRADQQPLRGLGPEDLLTRDEVARYVRIQTAEVDAWLTRKKVPRALSPGKRRIALYRVRDVRLALDEDRSGARETDARRRLSGA